MNCVRCARERESNKSLAFTMAQSGMTCRAASAVPNSWKTRVRFAHTPCHIRLIASRSTHCVRHSNNWAEHMHCSSLDTGATPSVIACTCTRPFKMCASFACLRIYVRQRRSMARSYIPPPGTRRSVGSIRLQSGDIQAALCNVCPPPYRTVEMNQDIQPNFNSVDRHF
jgi:hypothetical protein